jgi:hypothetical protein
MGIVPKEVIVALGEGNYQSSDVVGWSVTLLMADKGRHGELIYSERGKFKDLENGERGFHAVTKDVLNVAGDEELQVTGILKSVTLKSEIEKKKTVISPGKGS